MTSVKSQYKYCVSISFQQTYYLDSLIVYLSSERDQAKRGSSGHYVAFKLLNQQWFLLNDDQVHTCDLPTFPINIYMSFYRTSCTMGFALIRGLNVYSLPKKTDKQLKLLLRDAYGDPTGGPENKGQTPNPSKMKVNEGAFVSSIEPSDFTRKLSLKPQLLTIKPTSRKRKTADEEDQDYDPDADESQANDDDIEDQELEDQVVQEPKPKGLHLLTLFTLVPQSSVTRL